MTPPIIFITDAQFNELLAICKGCPNYKLKKKSSYLMTEEFPDENQPFCTVHWGEGAWHPGLHLDWVAGLLWDDKKKRWKHKEICRKRNDAEDA